MALISISDLFPAYPNYLVGLVVFLHISEGIRIDDLVSESPGREVRSLGDIEKLVEVGSLEDTVVLNGPEVSEDSEHGRFSAPVRTADNDVLASLDLEVHSLDEGIVVRSLDGEVNELDVVIRGLNLGVG